MFRLGRGPAYMHMRGITPKTWIFPELHRRLEAQFVKRYTLVLAQLVVQYDLAHFLSSYINVNKVLSR